MKTRRTQRMRAQWFFFLFLFVIGNKAQNIAVNVSVGLILDLGTEEAILSSIKLAIADFYTENIDYTTRIDLHVKDSKDDVVAAAAAALTLMQNDNVQAILGPSTSKEATFVAKLGEESEIPVITFSATNPTLTCVRSPYFFRATQNDSTQTGAISALMKEFQWREAAVIYDDNEFGHGILSYLADSLINVDSRISFRSPIPPNASDDRIENELRKIMGLQTKVIIVHMSPITDSGYKVLKTADRLGMMADGFVWLLTDGVVNLLDSADPQVPQWLHGALGMKPYIASSYELHDFQRRWKKENPGEKQDVYALYARDAVVALAIAIERLGSDIFRNQKSSKLVSSLNPRPVSPNGARLIEELSKVKFKGFTGDFRFVDGQLPEATYSIMNINNPKPRGFWTRQNGLSLTPDALSKTYETSKSNLLPIICQSVVNSAAKGWGIPANGKKITIAVPLKVNYSEFVTFTNNEPMGFCIDLFEELIKVLPYSLEPTYIPFNGTYTDMVYRVFTKEFDGAVGDITILANRSKYADFTLPYTDSWVFIVAKAKHEKSHDNWLFLRHIKSDEGDIFIASILFIFFSGLIAGEGVIWNLLRRRLRVMIAGEGVIWNLLRRRLRVMIAGEGFIWNLLRRRLRVMIAGEGFIWNLLGRTVRVMIVMWCFVTLLVIQSYTASLTRLLTVDVTEPFEYDVEKLIAKGCTVGVYKNSFLPDTLMSLGFDSKKIVRFDTYEQCNDYLQSGNITAAFIEKPYLRPFLGKYCNAYATKEAFPTGGFGFVFQHGSPLVNDMSKAILQVATNLYNVTKNGTMNLIERKWFPVTDCESNKLKSTTLDLRSCMGLFAIAAGVCLLAVVVSAVSFYLETMH